MKGTRLGVYNLANGLLHFIQFNALPVEICFRLLSLGIERFCSGNDLCCPNTLSLEQGKRREKNELK